MSQFGKNLPKKKDRWSCREISTTTIKGKKLPKKKLHLTLYVKVYKEPNVGWAPDPSSKLAWFLVSFYAKNLLGSTWGPI